MDRKYLLKSIGHLQIALALFRTAAYLETTAKRKAIKASNTGYTLIVQKYKTIVEALGSNLIKLFLKIILQAFHSICIFCEDFLSSLL